MREAVRGLDGPETRNVALSIILQFLTFDSVALKGSSDIAQARGALQQYLFSLGVLRCLEEVVEADADTMNLVPRTAEAEKVLQVLYRLTHGNSRDLINAYVTRPALFHLTISFIKTDEKAQALIRLLNCADTWPQEMLELYEDLRTDIPMEEISYWRCRSLLDMKRESDVDDALRAVWRKRTLDREAAVRMKKAGAEPRMIHVIRVQSPWLHQEADSSDRATALAAGSIKYDGILMRVDNPNKKEKDPSEVKPQTGVMKLTKHLPKVNATLPTLRKKGPKPRLVSPLRPVEPEEEEEKEKELTAEEKKMGKVSTSPYLRIQQQLAADAEAELKKAEG